MNQIRKPMGILTTVVVLVLCAGFIPPHAFAGANQRTSQGLPIHWKLNTPIPFAVNPGGVPGFSSELQRLVVVGAVEEAPPAASTVRIPATIAQRRHLGFASLTIQPQKKSPAAMIAGTAARTA